MTEPDSRDSLSISIIGTGSCVPDRIVTNDEAGAAAGVDASWIAERTGILARRWADPEHAASDLATTAAQRALEAAGVTADQLSSIVVATSTPDRPQPPTAVYVQHNLGATNAWALDTNAVCSGFLFALATIESNISRTGGYALVIGVDVYSRILDPTDRRTVILFGDGAGAVVLGPTGRAGRSRLVHTALHSYGQLSDLISVPAGGSREPYEPSAHDAGRHYFTMDGRAVRDFVTGELPALLARFLADRGVSADGVDHFIAHQANGVMLDQLVSRLGLSRAAEHRTVADYGNTGAASIPITLDMAVRAGAFAPGDTILLTGFGGGMAAAFALLAW